MQSAYAGENLLIGQYIDSYLPAIDGVTLTVRNYARWLNRNHCACYVAAAAPPAGYVDDDEFKVLRYRSISIKRRPPYRFGIPGLDFRFVHQQLAALPALLHAHSPFSAGREALSLAQHYHIPLVATFHSKYYDDILQATGSKFLAEEAVRIIVSFYEKADAVWAVNAGTAETLRGYGYRGDISIMPNGTDFFPIADEVAARCQVEERYHLDSGDKLVLFVGQHILQKNLSMLLDACAICRQTGGRFRLMMVGDGYAREQLQRQAQALRLDDICTFTGMVANRELLCSLYLRADIFLFPSVYDNAPLVLREAAMGGTPAILIGDSNAAGDTKDGENAFWSENDAHALARALKTVLDDDALRLAVGANARRTLARPWESVVADAYRAYLDILKDFSRPSRQIL